MHKFLIADDHPLFREALIGALRPLFEGALFVESDSLDTTLDSLSANQDVSAVLLDLNMPGCQDFFGVIRVSEDYPEIPVVVISASDDANTISKAIGFGALAFVSKVAVADTMADAIKAALDGQVWIPVEVRDKVDSISEEQKVIATSVAELTPKQFQVLKYLHEGQLNKQIAYEMGVTEATVKAHISAIFKKLKVNTRTQAVLLFEKLNSSHGVS